MVDDKIDLGDTLNVDYRITNDGDKIGTQDIVLKIDGSQVDSKTNLQVDVGISKTGTLQWDSTGTSTGTKTVTLESNDDSVSKDVEVVDPTGVFYLADITGTNEPVAAGQTFEITADIENVGDTSSTETVTFEIDNDQKDSKSISLNADETKSKTFSWSTTASDEGDFTADIITPDETDTQTISIGSNKQFNVSIDSTNSPVFEGEGLDVTATITNTKATTADQDIILETDNTQRDLENVALPAGDSKTITLTWTTDSGDAGTYTATVKSDDDSDTESVDVESGTLSDTISWTYSQNTNAIESMWYDKGSGNLYATEINSGAVVHEIDAANGDQIATYSISGPDDASETVAVGDYVAVADQLGTNAEVYYYDTVADSKTGSRDGDRDIDPNRDKTWVYESTDADEQIFAVDPSDATTEKSYQTSSGRNKNYVVFLYDEDIVVYGDNRNLNSRSEDLLSAGSLSVSQDDPPRDLSADANRVTQAQQSVQNLSRFESDGTLLWEKTSKDYADVAESQDAKEYVYATTFADDLQQHDGSDGSILETLSFTNAPVKNAFHAGNEKLYYWNPDNSQIEARDVK